MELFIALFAIAFTLVFIWAKYQHTYWQRRGIPHDKPHFPQGNLKGWKTTDQISTLHQKVYNKHKGTGPFAGFYFLLRPAVLVTDLDLVKNILIKDFNNFDDRGKFSNIRDDPLSGHLFNLNAEKWRPMRQKLTPTFTSGKMKFMYPTVLDIAQKFIDVFGDKVRSAENSVLEVTDIVSRFTADVIGSCAFGLECNSLLNPEADFVVLGKRAIIERYHNRILNSFLEAFPDIARRLHMRQTDPLCNDFYFRITKEAVDFREKNNIERNDFLNLLIDLKKNSKLTFNELAAQCFVFFFAGFDTSSTTMGFALYELSKNQEVQNKLREDIERVLEQNDNELTYECLQNIRYLEQVIYETLRKYPVLPFLNRISKQRYETSDPKYYIKKGCLIIIPVRAIHYDPDIYPNPEVFDPDRFTEEEIKKRPACSWIPFGDGPRNCIGMRFGKMQAAMGLALLIKNFKFFVCDETPKNIKLDVKNQFISSLGGIRLKVKQI